MIVYSNSDSYGVLSTGVTYPKLLADSLNAKVINAGLPGSCNQRIIRTTVRDLTQLRNKTDEPVLCLICLGFLMRGEWWDNTRPSIGTDGHFRSFQIHASKNIDNNVIQEYMKQWYRVYDDEATQTNLLMELVLLTNWLKSKNIKYIIFAGNNVTYKEIDYNDVFIKDFSSVIFSDKDVLNIHNFSFVKYCCDRGHVPFDFDLYQNHGHHGEAAHKEFANFLLEHYNERRH